MTHNPTEVMEQALRSRVYDVVRETDLQAAPRLSKQLGCQVWLKREDQLPIHSFKLRGAYQKIISLPEEERKRGIITVSAGNHAQGVAYTARHLGLRAVVVMPLHAPSIKVEAVRDLGAEVVLHGQNVTEAEQHAWKVQQAQGLTFVHPFDDPEVIAGQATIGLELLKQVPKGPFTVFVPVGGGGLIAGIAALLKTVRPDVHIVGVEPEESNAMMESVQAGKRVRLDQVGTFVDAVAVRQVGEHPYALALQHVDEWVQVSNDEVCLAIRDIYNDTRTLMEPGGALGVAGMKKHALQHGWQQRTLVTITSGANADFDRLREVAERVRGLDHVGRSPEPARSTLLL